MILRICLYQIDLSERAGKFYVAGKGTFNLKGQLKELGGKWDAANKAWRFDNDPTQAIADVIARTAGEGGKGGTGTGTNIRTDAERLAKRAEQDARPDERLDDYSNLVQAKTKSLVS